MTNQRKPAKRRGRLSPAMAAVTGAIVGAGVAIAGAAVLKDKKNRQKVKRALTRAKNQAVEYVEKLQKEVKNKKVKAKKSLRKLKKSKK